MIGLGLGLSLGGAGRGGGPRAERFTVSTIDDAALAIGPIAITAVRRIGGSAETIDIYDNTISIAGVPVFSRLMAPGDTVSFSPPIQCVNGAYIDVNPAVGPELVVNGTFVTDIAGWTGVLSPTLSWNAGRLQMVSAGSGTRCVQTITGLTVGQNYRFSGDVVSVAGTADSTAAFRLTTSTDGSSTGQVYSSPPVAVGSSGSSKTSFIAASTSITIACLNGSGLTCLFDNLSLRTENVADGSIELELSA